MYQTGTAHIPIPLILLLPGRHAGKREIAVKA